MACWNAPLPRALAVPTLRPATPWSPATERHQQRQQRIRQQQQQQQPQPWPAPQPQVPRLQLRAKLQTDSSSSSSSSRQRTQTSCRQATRLWRRRRRRSTAHQRIQTRRWPPAAGCQGAFVPQLRPPVCLLVCFEMPRRRFETHYNCNAVHTHRLLCPVLMIMLGQGTHLMWHVQGRPHGAGGRHGCRGGGLRRPRGAARGPGGGLSAPHRGGGGGRSGGWGRRCSRWRCGWRGAAASRAHPAQRLQRQRGRRRAGAAGRPRRAARPHAGECLYSN